MHLFVVALRLAKSTPNEGFASNPRHITAESAVTLITLRYLSPCVRLELRRVRAKLRSNGQFTSILLKTYGPPRLQGVLSRSADDQSASTYPASEVSSRPRWRCARPGPHKLFGVVRRFQHQAS